MKALSGRDGSISIFQIAEMIIQICETGGTKYTNLGKNNKKYYKIK
jgi:hypothetical protein